MILCACMNALKMVALSLTLFGLPVIVHFVRFGSMCAHFANIWLGFKVVYVFYEDGQVLCICCGSACVFGGVKLVTK